MTDALRLMIISPTRAHADVLRAMSEQPKPIDDPAVIAAFSSSLKALRLVLGADRCQPFIIPGTGTLGMETVVSNWLAPNDRVLVASTGFWGERFGDVAKRHGVAVTVIESPIGEAPNLAAIDRELSSAEYAALVWTHVDSSTGVLVDNAALANLATRHGALSMVDGIAGAAIEPFHQDNAGVDIYLTATPKGIAVPAGLILLSASPRACAALMARATLPSVYSTDLREWMPVMQALESGRFAYFATPAVNLVMALDAGLRLILEEGLPQRWQRHAECASALRAGMAVRKFRLLARPDCRSNALSTFWYPEGLGREFLVRVRAHGVVIAGGYHPTIGSQTFRIGHLGWVGLDDVEATLNAIDLALKT